MENHSYARRLQSGAASTSKAHQLNPIWTAPSAAGFVPPHQDQNLLSPPITPVKRPHIDIPISTMEFPPTPRASLDERPDDLPGIMVTKPRQFKGAYKMCRSVGSGAWANVYLAESSPSTSSTSNPAESSELGFTPPPSPAMLPTRKNIAVKKCYRKDGMRSLSHEARVLTYLSSDPATAPHVVPFHGIEVESDSLILDYAPLTLERYAKQAQSQAVARISPSNMHEPVVGEGEFKRHARAMIKGLAEMHAKGIAHGDVKSENILMHSHDSAPVSSNADSSSPSAYSAVFCDFSTAILTRSEDAAANADATDAHTQRYMSPELLASMSRSYRGAPVDRQKADVWALALCIVTLATGYELYSELQSRPSYMAIPWIQRGDVLGTTRLNSGHEARIMKGSRVAKTVAVALAIDPADRVTAREWLEKFDEIWA